MSETFDLEKGLIPRAFDAGNVVRVSVPVEVYYNLDKLQKVQKDIFGRLGHLTCCSGWDIRFELQRQFVVDEKLRVLTTGPQL